LRIAYGSASELETQVHLSYELELLDPNTSGKIKGDLDHVLKLLNRTLHSLKVY
jgi:four helix bundle protein